MEFSEYFFSCYEPAEADTCASGEETISAVALCVVSLTLAVISYYASYNRDWFIASLFNCLGLLFLRAQHQHANFPYAATFSKCYPMMAIGGILMGLYIVINTPIMIIPIIMVDIITVYRLYQMFRAQTFVFGAQLLVAAVLTVIIIFSSIAGPEISHNIDIEHQYIQEQNKLYK